MSTHQLIFPESVDSFHAHRNLIRSDLRNSYNRLHSISEDAAFVSNDVRESFPDFPIIPNQRAGAWYVTPVEGEETPHAYFKSTDGHAGQHDFNLRRANLALLPLIKAHTGIVLVDSTRRGKRFPDALSKTIPIWCAVLNRARTILLPPSSENSSVSAEDWSRDGALWTLESVIGRSEHSQIEKKINEWARKLVSSSFDLSSLLALDRPLRPLFISPSSKLHSPSQASSFTSFHPVICVSASKLAADQDGLERSSGFTYVQGSGDDHEAWSKGLTPALFWRHHQKILAANREEIDDVIETLLRQAEQDTPSENQRKANEPIWIRGTSVGVRFAVPLESEPSSWRRIQIQAYRGLRSDFGRGDEADGRTLRLCAKAGKSGHAHYFAQLDQAITFAKEALWSGDEQLVVEVGDLATVQTEANDLGLALTLILLVTLYNSEASLEVLSTRPTKDLIRSRLSWILEACPTINPSRAILQRVNEFLISAVR